MQCRFNQQGENDATERFIKMAMTKYLLRFSRLFTDDRDFVAGPEVRTSIKSTVYNAYMYMSKLVYLSTQN